MQLREMGACLLVRLEPGDEAMSAFRTLAVDHSVGFAWVQAIGAFRSAKLGYFDPAANTYQDLVIDEQVEVVALGGNIAWGENGNPVAHIHVVLGREDGRTVGGHLTEGTVFPTLEVLVTPLPGEVRRKSDPTTGLALWHLG